MTLTKGDETLLKVMPNTLNVTIDDAHFQSNSRLSELLDLGEALYSFCRLVMVTLNLNPAAFRWSDASLPA